MYVPIVISNKPVFVIISFQLLVTADWFMDLVEMVRITCFNTKKIILFY